MPQLLDLGNFRAVNTGERRSQALSWRLEENLSDWTIEINGGDVYRVHKSFLAAGKRSSLYFERLFQSSMAETSTSTSSIDLESSAARAFPVMLDFMYYHDDEVNATTYNAVALRYLANYFEMEELFDSVNRFIQEDFNASTALTYLIEANLYGDVKLFDAAGQECAKNFQELNEDQLLQLEPATLHKIVTHEGFNGDSFKLSRLVARACELYPDMPVKLLEQMTSFVRMPTVDPEVALSLLKSAMTRAPEVATLRNRTVKAASEQWVELAKCLDEKISHSFYFTLSDDVKVKVLEKSLMQARNDLQNLEEEKKDVKKELREKTRDLKRRQRLIAEATKEELTREFDEAMAELTARLSLETQTALAEKDMIIAQLRQQILESEKKQAVSRSKSKNKVVDDEHKLLGSTKSKSKNTTAIKEETLRLQEL